jgi:quinol monooxygenase YgiN
MITMVARMRVPQENAAAYEALLTRVAEQVRANEAEGVPYYAWAKSVETPDTYVVIEVYRDLGAHRAHMASSWVKDSLPLSMGLIDGRVDIQQYVSPGQEPVTTFVSKRA